MKKFNWMAFDLKGRNMITILRGLLGAFFVFSGGAKYWFLSSFAETLGRYRLIPEIAVPLFAWGIPAVEIALGLLLLIAWRVPKITLSLLIMVFIFTIAAFIKYQNGQVADCGCFGELLERKNNWVLFAENTGLMILLAVIHYLET